MRDLLLDEELMDCMFVIHDDTAPKREDDNQEAPAPTIIRAHKSILTARAEYFKALFRTNKSGIVGDSEQKKISGGFTFRESEESTVTVSPPFTAKHIRVVLEFIYTNRVLKLQLLNTDDLLTLLVLADQWLLKALKGVLQFELRKHITADAVARLYCVAQECNASVLAEHCMEYIRTHLRLLAHNPIFVTAMKDRPGLCLPILKAAADLVSDTTAHRPPHKKIKLTGILSTKGLTSSSQPVPDTERSFSMG
jgi:BTB/POZ domain